MPTLPFAYVDHWLAQLDAATPRPRQLPPIAVCQHCGHLHQHTDIFCLDCADASAAQDAAEAALDAEFEESLHRADVENDTRWANGGPRYAQLYIDDDDIE